MNDIADIYGDPDEGFDPASQPGASNFDLIPPAWYPAEVETSEIKDTKDGTGKYLNLQFGILAEKFGGRKVFARLNLKNKNPKAEEIGARELALLASASGLLRVKDSAEFIGKTVQIKLTVRKEEKDAQGNITFEASNEIKGYKALDGAAPAARPSAPAAPRPAAQAAPVAAAPAAAKAPPSFPWERK